MSKIRSLPMVLGISAALVLPLSAFAGGASSGAIVAPRPGGGGTTGGRGTTGGGTTGGRGTTGRGGPTTAQSKAAAQIAADRTQVATDQAAFNTANTNYTTDLTSFTTDYMKKPEYIAAQKDVDDNSAALDAARVAVINKLKDSSAEYRAAVATEATGRKKLDQMRAAGADRDMISTQAQAILDAGDKVSKLEAAALEKDDAYQACKKKLTAAADVLKTQKDAMAAAMKSDPKLTSEKTAVDNAKTALAAAQAKLAADGG